MEKWLNDIYNRLKDYEQDTPQGLWEELHARMKREELTGKKHRKYPTVLLWTHRTVAAACIAVALLLGYRYAPDLRHEVTLVSSTADSTETTRHTTFTENTHSPYTESPTTFSTIHRPALAMAKTSKPFPSEAFAEKDEEQMIATHSATSGKQKDSTLISDQQTNTTPATSASQPTQTSREKTSRTLLTTRRENTPVPHRNTNRKFTLSTHASGLSGTEMNSKSMNAFPASSLGPDNSDWNDSPKLGIAIFNQGKTVERNIHHRLPVRIGTSFSYDLNDYMAIGSGLTYSRLHSTLREGTEENYQRGEQNLHYMGIPITLKYTFFKKKNLNLYVQGGALAELRVAGKEKKEYILDGKNIGADTERITSHPLQMSVNLAAGMQYNLTSTLAAYAEPGVSHYFKDNSSIPTIYKEKPSNFSFNVGLRFRLGK